MGETVDQVEARINRARSGLAAGLHELEAKVDSVTDWRTHFEKQPFAWLGVAFVAGFVLSGPSGHGSGRVARALKAQTGAPTFDKFAGALSTIAVERAKDYLEAKLPGFSRAFDNVQTSSDYQRPGMSS